MSCIRRAYAMMIVWTSFNTTDKRFRMLEMPNEGKRQHQGIEHQGQVLSTRLLIGA